LVYGLQFGAALCVGRVIDREIVQSTAFAAICAGAGAGDVARRILRSDAGMAVDLGDLGADMILASGAAAAHAAGAAARGTLFLT